MRQSLIASHDAHIEVDDVQLRDGLKCLPELGKRHQVIPALREVLNETSQAVPVIPRHQDVSLGGIVLLRPLNEGSESRWGAHVGGTEIGHRSVNSRESLCVVPQGVPERRELLKSHEGWREPIQKHVPGIKFALNDDLDLGVIPCCFHFFEVEVALGREVVVRCEVHHHRPARVPCGRVDGDGASPRSGSGEGIGTGRGPEGPSTGRRQPSGVGDCG